MPDPSICHMVSALPSYLLSATFLRQMEYQDSCACVQDSDFLYLTGISQQGVAVIEAASPLRAAAYTLFVPDNDAHVSSSTAIVMQHQYLSYNAIVKD